MMMKPEWLWIEDLVRDDWAYRIRLGLLTIGRSSTADVCLIHNTVSREHATIMTSETGCILRDAGSQNGTFLNGRKITDEKTIHAGDRIQLGAIEFVVLGDLEASAKKAFDGGSTREMVRARETIRQRFHEITPGQRRVLYWLVRGLPEKQIAQELGITFHTVHSHVKEIYSILEVQSRCALIVKLAGVWDWKDITAGSH